ncbi:Tetratricopeptide-like helical [Penicillium concentricum]|uniref:Tetratricopeptide-like helical n=1 Tax=Penicillium concentricum TaxID=293559 RepID=A0A9W9VB11_9EURO|nr:Tetratricopeptide-like helical [Penicillium concentricum]KAJ5372791.1 Tetratricopeptide-like helical [Penicillium concentricum]
MDMRGKLSECRSISHDTMRSGRSVRSGTSSPRVAHFDGEVPPALSPLDAFAAQSRFLARQLDESRQGDRRMSRLPPASVARSLSQGRPGFGRSKSSTEARTELTRQPTQKGLPEYSEPKYRPISEHPRFSSVSNASTEASYYEDDDNATPRTTMLNHDSEAYGMPRAESPEGVASHASGADDALVGMAVAEPQGSSIDSSFRLDIPRTLAPPVSPRSRPSSSAKVAHPESSDDDYSSSNGGSTFSKPRKLSSGSAVSLPYSPMSTFPARAHPRSPSMSSETSGTGGNHLPRPSFNFSRPLSRSSTTLSAPGASTPTDPILGSSSNHMTRRGKPTPLVLQLTTEDVAAIEAMDGEPSSAVSSYVYAKYALPRGRFLSRDSVVFAGLQTPHFEWDEPLFEKTPPRHSEEPPRMTRTPSPTPHRQLAHSPKPHSMHEVPASKPQSPAPKFQPQSPPQSPPQPQLQPQTPKSQRIPPPPPVPDSPIEPVRPSVDSTRETINEKDETVSSADSASTMRPQTANAPVTASGLTADDHVAKGIECHERGSLSESTYHLRVAAKQDHPTGMLLYALACRHGWGMRSNEKEGVRWLRKAVDSVGLEMLADPDAPGASKAKELQKAYRAQFALSIYELGVSYLNGWGIEQDKSLALRCFEIAGQWGDVDAMAEAGFCYAEGVGCKKDMKKAARFYRQAESKGMSMVGNSWIYKDKYNETDAPSHPRGRNASGEKDKKSRSKSRTRSIFQRKKSIVPEA